MGKSTVLFRTSRYRLALLLALTLSAGLTTSSCSDTAARPAAPPVPFDPTRVMVEGLLESFDAELREHAEAAATGAELTKLLENEAKRSWNARIAGGIKYADLFLEIYAERGERKLFAGLGGMKPRGEVVLRVLAAAGDHALDPAPYHVARIQHLDGELEKTAAEAPVWETIEIQPEEAEALVRWIRTQKLDPHDPSTRTTIYRAVVTRDAADSPLPRVTRQVRGFEATFQKTARAAAELELRLADGALRYARDMKHFNLVRLDWRDLKAAGGSTKLIYGRLRETFVALAEATPETVDQVFDGLQPPHPQYALLVQGLARYRAIAARGGWKPVKKVKLQPGTRSPRIEALRERLAAEGYLNLPSASAQPESSDDGARASNDGPDEAQGTLAPEVGESPSQTADLDIVDQPLVDAIHAYQETHQFNASLEPPNSFWKSLNVPIERRIRQIELTLERWRESRYENEPDYVFVNIPDFHAEVFENHERTMRFRVVVGNKNRKCDPETKKWVYPNRTPLQVATLDHLIVNPSWWIPQRILEEEIYPSMAKDPEYLEKNNYEIVKTRDGKERIRQKPGDDNALGRVKFIFPNVHNTYMHDTPMKKYFNYPVRAFSHGCVRVHEPMDFARYLLKKDELATPEELDAILEGDRTKKFDVKTKMPVFFEYYVVKGDDQGRLHFLADVYKLDKRRLSEDVEEFDSCVARTPKGDDDDADGEDTAPTEAASDVGP